VVVDVCGPCAVERNEARGVDSAQEYILGHKVALVPDEHLLAAHELLLHGRVAAFAYAQEPVPVRVVPVLEPFVDQDVRRVVVQRLANELTLGHG
jgi:hypothetical protein